ncbi:hypothetical protein IQ254_30890 [Nodosilinea sp. LEGE 07088]|uniref:hypothetical protein n=1 Tax=Nodosilinea sp. LEGE 07088 TaxID=2777968 RepID=UPI0018811857|nr:hypothetical protein [Nodosilinea sp. LEGE 07088]MBE9141546.1 hypothetical protein [Nodosilinea sp. LEGE 07088]
MIAKTILKRFAWIIFWVLFALAIILGGWKLLSFFPFMENYLSSVITTTIGVVIGIPVALTINDYQRKLQFTETSKQLENERLSKEILLLQYIKEELGLNKSLLENAVEGQKSAKNYLTYLGMKSDFWISLLSSGDLKHISDTKVLNSVSSSYFFINRIKELEKVYYHPNFFFAVSSKDKESYTGKRAVDTVEYLRPVALEQITETYNLISEFLDRLSP